MWRNITKTIVLKKRKTACYIFLCLFLFSTKLYSQQPAIAVIKGRITTPDNKPAPYAAVALKKLDKKTVADKNGLFEIQGLPALKDTLIISAVGLKTTAQAVT